jgi:hypothetical protein
MRARARGLGAHHQGAVAERLVEVWSENGAALSSRRRRAGQPRPSARRGPWLLVYEADERSLTVHVHLGDGDWRLTAERRFPRGTAALG